MTRYVLILDSDLHPDLHEVGDPPGVNPSEAHRGLIDSLVPWGHVTEIHQVRDDCTFMEIEGATRSDVIQAHADHEDRICQLDESHRNLGLRLSAQSSTLDAYEDRFSLLEEDIQNHERRIRQLERDLSNALERIAAIEASVRQLRGVQS